KLYTTAFYRAVSRHLSAQGFVAVQSTSPMFARDSFWCIAETLKQAGLQTYPYHVYVPSFGEWGFVLAGTHGYVPPKSLPAGLRFKSGKKIEGSFVNDSFQMGHLLRGRAGFPAARRIEKFSVVIVGGGIAGLSAAWRLRKRGFTDFVLLEMNAQPGGNARWDENEITAYPWAAHYVPVPGPRAEYVRELFEDLGV